MIHLRSSEISKLNLYESFISGLHWENGGLDFVLYLYWSGQDEYKEFLEDEKLESKIVFRFATDLFVNIVFAQNEIGPIEIGDVVFEKVSNVWSITIFKRFGPNVIVSLKCNELDFYGV